MDMPEQFDLSVQETETHRDICVLVHKWPEGDIVLEKRLADVLFEMLDMHLSQVPSKDALTGLRLMSACLNTYAKQVDQAIQTIEN